MTQTTENIAKAISIVHELYQNEEILGRVLEFDENVKIAQSKMGGAKYSKVVDAFLFSLGTAQSPVMSARKDVYFRLLTWARKHYKIGYDPAPPTEVNTDNPEDIGNALPVERFSDLATVIETTADAIAACGNWVQEIDDLDNRVTSTAQSLQMRYDVCLPPTLQRIIPDMPLKDAQSAYMATRTWAKYKLGQRWDNTSMKWVEVGDQQTKAEAKPDIFSEQVQKLEEEQTADMPTGTKKTKKKK